MSVEFQICTIWILSKRNKILIKKYLLVRLLRLIGFIECIEAYNCTTPAISDIDYTTFEL